MTVSKPLLCTLAMGGAAGRDRPTPCPALAVGLATGLNGAAVASAVVVAFLAVLAAAILRRVSATH